MGGKQSVIARVLISISLILTSPYFPQQVIAPASAEASGEILDLTMQILSKEISLERFYVQYKIVASKEPKYRYLRYFLGQQASLALFMAGDIVGINEAGRHFKDPQNISIPAIRSSLRTELVGSIIGGASSGLELCSNALLAAKNKRHHNDPTSAQHRVQDILQDVDSLLAKRDYLVNREKDSAAYDIYAAEGKLMHDYRDWCVYEFADIYADVKSYQSSMNVYYLLSTAFGSIYSASSILAIRSFKQPELASSSIVTAIIGDSLSLISAPASYLYYKLSYKHHLKQVYKTLDEKTYNPELASWNALEKLHETVNKTNDSILTQAGPIKIRLAAYALWNERYDSFIDRKTKHLRRLDKVALQSATAGPVFSGSFLAQDILGAVAYYGNRNRLRMANNLAFAGYVTSEAGASAAFGMTNLYILDEILYSRKLKKEGNMPEQLLEERLRTLDEVEKMIGLRN